MSLHCAQLPSRCCTEGRASRARDTDRHSPMVKRSVPTTAATAKTLVMFYTLTMNQTRVFSMKKGSMSSIFLYVAHIGMGDVVLPPQDGYTAVLCTHTSGLAAAPGQ